MSQRSSKKKSDILPVFMMGCLFLIVYGLVLLLSKPFVEEGGVSPAFEDVNNPMNIVYIFIILLAMTLAILLIAKYWKEKLIQFIILGAVGYTSFFAFFLPIFSIAIPLDFLEIILILSIICAIFLVITLYKYPEWYVIDISGIIVGVGAIVIFGISLGVLLVIILLVALAVYDAISVYKTKHMIDLADTVMDLKLPVLLVIPKIRHYSLIKETKRLKEKLEEKEERDAFFMGLGDIVMPGILVGAVYHNVEGGLPIALSIILGVLVGFSILIYFVMKGKPQAGLPTLCGGAIAGYVISSLILFGELRGLTFSF
jgi:presenilin-like A22 family membrane protease